MAKSKSDQKPADSRLVPRFGDIATFMRLPLVRDLSEVDIAIAGVPCDLGAGNRAGARHGPRAIREMSSLVRRVHPVTHFSPYKRCRVADVGDSPVNPNDLMDSLALQEAFFRKIHAAGVAPLTAGGGHLITLPIMRAIADSSGPLGMVHFDAHSDTNDVYQGNVRYNNGTPFRRAVEEGLLDPKRTIQIGIRGTNYSADEHDYPLEIGIRVVTIEEFHSLGVEAVIAEARKIVGNRPCYISFDIDGIDPCFAPATGTPEIGGLTSFESQQLIRGLDGLDVVGADLVEVAPPYDHADMTSHLAANLMFELLCVLAPAVARRKSLCGE
jgi:guanidinopropionase